MALYLIGDVQGCDAALGRMLHMLDFSPSRDQLVLLGDLVNRGPDSAAVLRRVHALGGAAQSLLGNHDLHLLGVAHGVRKPGRRDTLAGLLAAPDREALLDWLRQQSMALHRRIGGRDLLMLHAGVLPQWDVAQTLACAAELEAVLRSPQLGEFLHQMYGNEPDRWDDGLRGSARLRVIVNALTRLRLCTAEGVMEFDTKDDAASAPAGFMPWFDVPGRRTADATIAFGHWSTLGYVSRPDLLATDTGCVWGGCLTAVRIGSTLDERERIEVHCEAAQQPG
ncbi:symmetrical bis(5'-nucleosyl)-tetraphosphatase [Xenophilus arseniciresistens]|uniref:bis(5'-nucleosyl)-tetraphosphatase (symmetrical) n=1 Tax=Xenophilus arseniciresistens TaxID=1283306 RepID=A0AAE3N692_9BURK|nr:symmetrical bis(5'-nucleosyl)-tetraphosphatase [Xenophilus arseniciresistens]MDA7415284.1 symmetrical bis(5'-nucleosyl)-tetraphosphatase [Xenophilus arseniciresistens]